MTLRLLPVAGGFACVPHKVFINLMISSVNYPDGCEECIRAAFAEALERALEENKRDRTKR